MRLSRFILDNLESILAEWERFAGSQPKGLAMTKAALRDDAEAMLRFIAGDMETGQNAMQQQSKAEGRGPPAHGGAKSAAQTHAVHRLGEGFDLNELIAEYRALRASVLRLWFASEDRDGSDEMQQVVRFNEGLDQVVAESVLRFTSEADHAKDLLLAVLGHDLRNPLNAIAMSAELLGRHPERGAEVAQHMKRSAERMRGMIEDLLDFARTRLGSRLELHLSPCNVGAVCSQAIDELRAAHPSRRFDLIVDGTLDGDWDCGRLGQLASNLVANAVQHGDRGTAITVTVRGHGPYVELTVHNHGPSIADTDAGGIFDPLIRGPANRADARAGNLGLGLYIAKQIAAAHAGELTLRSSDATGTLFAVMLPRTLPEAWPAARSRSDSRPEIGKQGELAE
jgi:signal transduction histidine kinase